MLAVFVGALAVVYVVVLWRTIATKRRLSPYFSLLALHGVAALWFWSAVQDIRGSDASSGGMAIGYTLLFWAAANALLALIAIVVFLVQLLLARRRLR